jgi:uncharacterized damage-inducible protein DinB
MTMIEREGLIEALAAMPDRVGELIDGLSEKELRRRPAEGEWSMKEVCGHLVVDARTWQERITLMMTENDPYLKRYDSVGGVTEGGYQEGPIEETMSELRRIRRQTVETLRGLSAEGWERRGRHWSEGEMTIARACEIGLEHGEEHLEQLRETREKVAGQ